jgi:hypothetical protein
MHLFSLFSYDGTNFIKNIEAGVEDRLKKRGKPPRIVRYFFIVDGHALIVSLQSVIYIIAPGSLDFCTICVFSMPRNVMFLEIKGSLL